MDKILARLRDAAQDHPQDRRVCLSSHRRAIDVADLRSLLEDYDRMDRQARHRWEAVFGGTNQFTYRAQGEPNQYVIFYHDRWIAHIQFNGELTVPQQEIQLKEMLAALEVTHL